MWQHLAFDRVRADVLALQAKAELAGCALGCAYMSTAEFEAAVIRSKRAAGVYGRRRLWGCTLGVGAGAAALAIFIFMI